jgi:hypothetical protein
VIINPKMFLKLKSSSSLDLFALIGSTHWRKLASDSGDADPPRQEKRLIVEALEHAAASNFLARSSLLEPPTCRIERVIVNDFKRGTYFRHNRRGEKGLVDLVNELETQKVHFQSITDGIDTKTPAGRFFFHVMASLTQMERELIMERTRAGR